MKYASAEYTTNRTVLDEVVNSLLEAGHDPYHSIHFMIQLVHAHSARVPGRTLLAVVSIGSMLPEFAREVVPPAIAPYEWALMLCHYGCEPRNALPHWDLIDVLRGSKPHAMWCDKHTDEHSDESNDERRKARPLSKGGDFAFDDL